MGVTHTTPDLDNVAKTARAQHRDPSALVLKQRVGCDRRAVNDLVEASFDIQGLQSFQKPLVLMSGSGGDFHGGEAARGLVQADQIGEGPTHIDANANHDLLSSRSRQTRVAAPAGAPST